jgi:NADPH:quinone reductase-like Zn-dependent oxidoreductase
MRVYEIQDSFGLDNLTLMERPDPPPPGSGQIVVRMKAVSLNYRDLMTVRGHYNPKQPLPLIPCSDGVGEVIAIGAGVTRVAVGERVATCFSQTWQAGPPSHEKVRGTLGGPLDGTLAEQMVLGEQGVIQVADHLTDAEAACLPCAGLTAWSALVTLGGVTAGDTVLVQGTGGVSIFALQFARILGARVIVTSSSDEKLARARALGASETINYREISRWGQEVLALTDGRGVDHVVEVGGAGTLAQSLDAVRIGGTISVIGVLSGVATELSVIPILMKQVRLQGLMVGHREGFQAMNRAVASHGMRPVVDRVLPFDQAPAAFQHMASGQHFGKIVIAVGSFRPGHVV